MADSHVAHAVLHAALERHLGAYPFLLLLLLLFYRVAFASDRPNHLFSDIVLSFVATGLPSRVRRLIARAIEARVDTIALQRCDFKVDSSEFDDVSNPYHLLLIVGEEVFQNLIYGSFLTNDQPHGPVQVDVVLLVFVGLSLGLRLLVDRLGDVVSIDVRLLAEVGLVEERFVVRPQATILVLHQEAEHDLIFPF